MKVHYKINPIQVQASWRWVWTLAKAILLLFVIMNADRETLVQKDNNRWQYILGHSVTMAKMSRFKWEIRFGSRMVEFEHLVQAFAITSLPVEGAKTVFLLSLESPSWIKTKETVSSVLTNLSRPSVVSQDHTSQDHFCSVINEFPVWNSKSFKPRWWDKVSHPEREAVQKIHFFWALMIACFKVFLGTMDEKQSEWHYLHRWQH